MNKSQEIQAMVDKAIGILSAEPSPFVLYKEGKKEQLAEDIRAFARDCFEAGREISGPIPAYKYETFDAFLDKEHT